MKSAFVTIFFMLLICTAFAQPGTNPPPAPEVPIDAGIGFLMVAGAAFGIKKVHDFNKKKK